MHPMQRLQETKSTCTAARTEGACRAVALPLPLSKAAG